MGVFYIFMKGQMKWQLHIKKLWHMLLDRNMKKKDLQRAANLTNYAMNKLSRNETVTTDVLAKVCRSLNCTVDDIMEVLPETEEK